MEEIGVPFAVGLFSAEEALLLGRGKREADQKRELALQKYREWSRGKGREARRAKRQEQAAQEKEEEKERQRKFKGLKAYRRWLRLESKQSYFSSQSNTVVARSRVTPRPELPTAKSTDRNAIRKGGGISMSRAGSIGRGIGGSGGSGPSSVDKKYSS
ncbi:unnamed protein product, partial [Laminaria digitata]